MLQKGDDNMRYKCDVCGALLRPETGYGDTKRDCEALTSYKWRCTQCRGINTSEIRQAMNFFYVNEAMCRDLLREKRTIL